VPAGEVKLQRVAHPPEHADQHVQCRPCERSWNIIGDHRCRALNRRCPRTPARPARRPPAATIRPAQPRRRPRRSGPAWSASRRAGAPRPRAPQEADDVPLGKPVPPAARLSATSPQRESGKGVLIIRRDSCEARETVDAPGRSDKQEGSQEYTRGQGSQRRGAPTQLPRRSRQRQRPGGAVIACSASGWRRQHEQPDHQYRPNRTGDRHTRAPRTAAGAAERHTSGSRNGNTARPRRPPQPEICATRGTPAARKRRARACQVTSSTSPSSRSP